MNIYRNRATPSGDRRGKWAIRNGGYTADIRRIDGGIYAEHTADIRQTYGEHAPKMVLNIRRTYGGHTPL